MIEKEHFSDLPRWSLVALAARCARRAQRCLPSYWHATAQGRSDVIEKAIQVAEYIAGAAVVSPEDAGMAHRNAKAAGELADTIKPSPAREIATIAYLTADASAKAADDGS